MASEAEHVGPLTQPQVGVLGADTEVPGGVDHAAGVVGELMLGEFGIHEFVNIKSVRVIDSQKEEKSATE